MRGTRALRATIVFTLVFAAISSAPNFAHAQSKQEIRIYAGGELGGTSGEIDVGASIGIAYAPIRYLSFGIVGAYALLPGNGCEVLVSGDAGEGCSKLHPYRVTTEIELTPFDREVVQPFFVADAGIFGEHDTQYGADPKVSPTFGGGGGLHFFPIKWLSVDFALRVLYASFPNQDVGNFLGIFSVGATPRISF